MTNADALQLFEDAGALLSGHFRLSSGLHSDAYLEKFRLVERPDLLTTLCQTIANKFKDDNIEIVLGPTTAGIILAYDVARYLGVEARYAETEGTERKLRRGQVLDPSTRVLVVDDILTTGKAIRECLDVINRHEAVLAGVGVLGDRSGGSVQFGARLEAALTMKVETWTEEDCPQCKAGVPIYQPGTRNLS